MSSFRCSGVTVNEQYGGEVKFPAVWVGAVRPAALTHIRSYFVTPTDMGVAIVIVNHLRTVATRLHEILQRYTNIPVKLITEGLVIQPNTCCHPGTARFTRARWRVPSGADIQA